jgi:hypothetical protein
MGVVIEICIKHLGVGNGSNPRYCCLLYTVHGGTSVLNLTRHLRYLVKLLA